MGELVCPGCGSRFAAEERFCPACALPLVHDADVELETSESHRRARKIKPQLAEGELVRVTGARNQAEAEFIQGLLLEEGVPSMLRRSAGFDVPDFLAAGPRDVLVPASGVDTAREVLLQAELIGSEPQGSPVAPGKLLIGLLVALAFGALVVWLATLAGHAGAAEPIGRPAPERRSVRAGPRAASGASATPPRCVAAAGRRTPRRGPRSGPCGSSRIANAAADGSPCSRASRSITVPPSSVASRSPGGKRGCEPSCRRRAIAGRACSVWPQNQRAAPSSSHAQRSSRRTRIARITRCRSRLLSMITRRAYSAAALSASISREPVDVRGARPQQRRGEDVQLGRPGPPGDVAARRRVGHQPQSAASPGWSSSATRCCRAARP